ncbi:MAG: family 14 glycosylhydrolase [Armatimonadota bacterium]
MTIRHIMLTAIIAFSIIGTGASAADKAAVSNGKPMVVLMGSVTNAMWPIKDLPAMEKTAIFARSLGVDVFESYTPWSVLEPKGLEQFDWTETDKLDSICRKTGLKWQAFIGMNPSFATPGWYRESGEDVPHKCLEHNQDSDVRSIWCPNLDKHIDRVMGALFARYKDSPALESVMFGVSGDFGESIYPAGAVGWNGQYHNHAGFWCAEEPAVKDFRNWTQSNYKSIARLNSAWGTKYGSFNEVNFLLPDKMMSDARWLDQCEWYRGEMTDWCEQWFKIARKYAKSDLPLYLCVGGGDNVMLGFDITGQAKMCAKYNVWLRLTNEGSVYPNNFMGTRQLTTAAKLYGVPSGLEPAGEVNDLGVAARIFGAAAAGCNHLHYYETQVAHFNAVTPAENRTATWNKEREHLIQKAPYVNVAAFYPRVDSMCKRLMGTESINRYSELRDYIDFDFVDDNLVRDGKLDRYRCLLLGPCETMDAGAYTALVKWIKAGGVLISTEQPKFRTWKPFGVPAFSSLKPLTVKPQNWASVSVEVPAKFDIHPGQVPAGVELIGNWSHSEGDFRWGGKDAGLLISVNPKFDYMLTYEGGVPVGGSVLVNGQEVGKMEGGPGNEHTWNFKVPAKLLKGSNVMRLEFRMTPMKLATDTRDLCIYPKTITLQSSGGNTAIDAPRMTEVLIDRKKLASSTSVIGKGRVITMPPGTMSPAQYSHIIAKLLRTQLLNMPACSVPDGIGNGLFVTLRGDEVLVYNGNTNPVTTKLVIPAGAELDRYHTAVGTTIEIRDMAPNTIEAYPLKVKQAIY